MARDDGIAEFFKRFVAALVTGDVEAFRALAVEDVAPQEEAFLINSKRVREQGLTLRLRKSEEEGDVAEVFFDVSTPGGAVQDQGRITLTREPDGWRLRAL